MRPSLRLLLIDLDHRSRSSEASSSNFLEITRSHASIHPSNPTLQKIHLEAEVEYEAEADIVRSACQTVIKAVTRPHLSVADQKIVQSIWRIWAAFEEKQCQQTGLGLDHGWEPILRDSLRLGEGLPDLHPSLLGEYCLSALRCNPLRPVLPTVERISAKYRPNPIFFDIVFAALSYYSNDRFRELSRLYEIWRRVCREGQDRVQAAMAWAGWLLKNEKGREAGLAVAVARREVRDDELALAELERGWKGMLDQRERMAVERMAVEKEAPEVNGAELSMANKDGDEESRDSLLMEGGDTAASKDTEMTPSE